MTDQSEADRFAVALLTEGVDRNRHHPGRYRILQRVALLTEGVDRNILVTFLFFHFFASPSSRRAWIEIAAKKLLDGGDQRRPPHGGRG